MPETPASVGSAACRELREPEGAGQLFMITRTDPSLSSTFTTTSRFERRSPTPALRRPTTRPRNVNVDRISEGRTTSSFSNTPADLCQRGSADIVIDMICFTEASARLHGQVRHFLHSGTIWAHGPSVVPTIEIQPRRPFGEYGIAKAAIEAYLIEMARKDSLDMTGWMMLAAPSKRTRLELIAKQNLARAAWGPDLATPFCPIFANPSS